MPNIEEEQFSGYTSCQRTIYNKSGPLLRRTTTTTTTTAAAAAHNLRRQLSPLWLLTLLLVAGLCTDMAHGSPTQTGRNLATERTQQCREGCFEKYATKDTLCQQSGECLTCWDECAKPAPAKINKSIRETWSLHTVSMLQQDSLVLVDVAWLPLSSPNQCLVTWEVSGGGLMGNLLTESFNVQLSLWPDTKYRVQVTCKNKITGAMSRSLPLTIDTSEAILSHEPDTKPTTAVSTLQPQSQPDAAAADATITDLKSNNLDDTSDEQENPASVVVAGGGGGSSNLPYDDQSAETINQHTNFIFNWHTKNSDISAIEPLHKPELSILTVAALSELQKPLLFGVIAGTLLLAFILLLYVCMLRQQRLSSDKAALMADDVHSAVVSMPPPSSMMSTTVAPPPVHAVEVCKHAASCSRNMLKV